MRHRRLSCLAAGRFALLVVGALAPWGTSAQVRQDTTRVTLSGMVYDRARGTPISGALVRLAGTDFQATTGEDGHYAIVGLPRGAYQVELDARGYRAVRGGLSMLHTGELDFPMDRLTGTERAELQSRIVGRVVAMENGRPVEGAEITLAGRTESRISDEQGRFEITGLQPGTHSFSVRYLGRAPLEAKVEVPEEQTLEVEIRLAVKPVELEPMIVTATPRNSYLEDMGFYRRRDQGLSGTQITRQILAEMNPRSFAEVFVGVPGVRVIPTSLGLFEVRMRRSIRLNVDESQGCIPALYIDDIRSDPGWIHDLDPARVEALEVYTGANAPLRYNDPCGVILVWTRRGERARGGG